jgi:hypothetical protein
MTLDIEKLAKPTVRKVWRNELNRGDNFDWPTQELAEISVRNFGRKKFSRIAVPITITETKGH